MLILESFQAGLSWECVLNKRDDFKKAFDNFDIDKICNYTEDKIEELLQNKKIIRNKLKINATINNSKIFKKIQNEYGTFYKYLMTFTNNKIIYEIDKTTNELSDSLSKDLKKRGMKFVGSTIIYSYLQAIGVIYSHDKECFMYYQAFVSYVDSLNQVYQCESVKNQKYYCWVYEDEKYCILEEIYNSMKSGQFNEQNRYRNFNNYVNEKLSDIEYPEQFSHDGISSYEDGIVVCSSVSWRDKLH